MTAELVVIGGGKMGEALSGGLLAAGWASPSEVLVVEAAADRRQALAAAGGLAERYPALQVIDPARAEELAGGHEPVARGALIAVKPGDVPVACGLVARLGVQRVLSIAAGLRIDALAGWVSDAAKAAGRPAPVVLRAMPNTPALVGAGASGLSGGPDAGDDDLAWAEAILAAVGLVVRVAEPALDAVTGLSGSGPAYVFLIAEALTDAGVLVGLPRPMAAQLATRTLLGAARMLDETGQSPEALRAAVTSPGGTTAAGLRALEAAAVRSAMIDAVVASAERARELGG
jgi:pyrroline-5-carboxylate reductase